MIAKKTALRVIYKQAKVT